MLRVGSRLDELDQHAAGVLGMDEVDPRIRGAAPRRSTSTLGPKLSDGRQSVIMVTDDNFSSDQVTQVLAFAW